MKSLKLITVTILLTIFLAQCDNSGLNSKNLTLYSSTPPIEGAYVSPPADALPKITLSVVKYIYNASGDIEQKIMIDHSLNDSILEVFTYDDRGLLTESSLKRKGQIISKKRNFFNDTMVTNTTYANSEDIVYVSKEYKYDDQHRLTEITVKNGAGRIESITSLKLSEEGKIVEKHINSYMY